MNREVPGIAPVIIKDGRNGGGFVEFLASNALVALDVAILFRTAWLDDLHGNTTLLEEFLQNAAELKAVVDLDLRMTTGKISRMRSKASHML